MMDDELRDAHEMTKEQLLAKFNSSIPANLYRTPKEGDPMIPERLYAWVGLDEYGSGEPGLKQAVVPAGRVPLVATSREKLDREYIVGQLQSQASLYDVTIRLVEYSNAGIRVVKELQP